LKSYDTGPISPPILEETIGENFERTVAANPDGEALVDVAQNRRWTYAELNAEIDLTARGLMSLGVQHRDRVGIWSPNCAEWIMVQYAAAKIGAILVSINPAYRTQELGYALNQSGVRTLVAATAFKSSDYRCMVGEVRPNADGLRDVVFIGTGDWNDGMNHVGAEGVGESVWLAWFLATVLNSFADVMEMENGTVEICAAWRERSRLLASKHAQ